MVAEVGQFTSIRLLSNCSEILPSTNASNSTPRAYGTVPTPSKMSTIVNHRNETVGSPSSRKPTVSTVVTDW